jgi:CHAT domain-containing protein
MELASLDIGGAELVTLSACETGLGPTAGGEGVLGLQRAFQVSGTRTVVASLWPVPDRATRLLMDRFYENLWNKKMTKLQALREAQLALLNANRPGGVEIRGGLTRLSGDRPGAADARTPPFFWAGWVLSGDWR